MEINKAREMLEGFLTRKVKDKTMFSYHLFKVLNIFTRDDYISEYYTGDILVATPPQLVEAIIKTIGKWED